MSTRIRKHDSGAAKHKKKRRLEVEAQSQTGALDRYIVRGTQLDYENQTVDLNVDDGPDDNAAEVEAPDAEIDGGNFVDEGGADNTQRIGDKHLKTIAWRRFKYEDMIEDFISKNTRQMLLFGRTRG